MRLAREFFHSVLIIKGFISSILRIKTYEIVGFWLVAQDSARAHPFDYAQGHAVNASTKLSKSA